MISFDVEGRQVIREEIVSEVTWNTSLDLRVWRDTLFLVYHDYEFEDRYKIGTLLPGPAELRIKKIEMPR